MGGEVDAIRALEAKMEGFQVQTLAHALKYELADIIVTTTGNKHVVDREHFALMKDGTILANSGHFNVEINMEELEKVALRQFFNARRFTSRCTSGERDRS